MHFELPLRSFNLQLVAGAAHYQPIFQAVQNAGCSVWIATANLKHLIVKDDARSSLRRARRPWRSFLDEFDDLARKQVELRILHAKMPSRAFREMFDAHQRLIEGGLELRLCPRVHFKAVIVDGRFLYFGSANWTGAGLGAKSADKRNFELGAITTDPIVLDQVQAMYDHIWTGQACPSCNRREHCEAPLDIE